MSYFLLTVSILFMMPQNILMKEYNLRLSKPNIFFFTGITAFAALVFYTVSALCTGGLSFPPQLIPYGLGIAVAYVCAVFGEVYALGCGPMSVTLLLMAYSLLIPTFYGVLFLNEPLSSLSVIGILFLVVCIFLINVKKDESMKFRPLWFVFLPLGFIGNGMCSTVQKLQQLRFDGAYRNETMMVAMAAVTVVALAAGVLTQKTGKKETFSRSLLFALPNGVCNGTVNLLVMILQGMMPLSILYPTFSAVSILLSALIALIHYREKLTKPQLVGFAFGIASIVFLNL